MAEMAFNKKWRRQIKFTIPLWYLSYENPYLIEKNVSGLYNSNIEELFCFHNEIFIVIVETTF